jgi:D-alanine-D-alanine ligase
VIDSCHRVIRIAIEVLHITTTSPDIIPASMRKLRVLVLMHHYMVPPDDVSGHNPKTATWRTEYDVLRTLRKLKHEVYPLAVHDDLAVIRQARDEFKPHIAFNLLEAFHEVGTFDQHVVAYLELLRLPYTGSNPRGMFLSRDKALSKKLLQYHRIPVPEFMLVRRGRRPKLRKRVAFPLIVKSLTQEASIGIAQASVVHDEAKLTERVQFIHDSIGTDAIVEEYVDGQELYCGIIGNHRLDVLPVWEMTWENLPEGRHRIATSRAKWSPSYQERVGVMTGATDVSNEAAEKIQRMSRRVYRVLELSGYARIDIRLDATGKPHVLEANPNPQLADSRMQVKDFYIVFFKI